MFKNISLKNFRGFENLTLDGLQRVNLVVGKNNTGKTSLLEAIAVIAKPSLFGPLPHLFRETTGGHDRRFFRWIIRDEQTVEGAELSANGRDGDRLLLFLRNADARVG